MNKKILFLVLFGLLLLPVITFGAVDSIQSLMKAIVNGVVWVVFTAIVVVCFVYSGIMFLTAQGDSSKLATARASFLWGIVGVVVGIIAYSAIDLISDIIT